MNKKQRIVGFVGGCMTLSLMIITFVAAFIYSDFENWKMMGAMFTVCIINAVFLITAFLHYELLAARFDKIEKLINELNNKKPKDEQNQ
jgi:hypothetical protein